MLAKEEQLYTFEEYLILEEKAAYKSEYRQGRIVAMAGASLAHNRIVGNIYANLYNIYTYTILARGFDAFLTASFSAPKRLV